MSPSWPTTSSRLSSATRSSGSSRSSARLSPSGPPALPADEPARGAATRKETRQMNDSFDMIVIGAGPAGEKAAVQAAFYGKRVAVVDQAATPGGSAVQSAGVPTKTLRETALYLTGFQRRDTYGLSLQLLPSLALERLLTRTAEVIATRTASVQANLDRQEVQLLRGEARLGPDRSVIVRSNGSERALQAGE